MSRDTGLYFGAVCLGLLSLGILLLAFAHKAHASTINFITCDSYVSGLCTFSPGATYTDLYIYNGTYPDDSSLFYHAGPSSYFSNAIDTSENPHSTNWVDLYDSGTATHNVLQVTWAGGSPHVVGAKTSITVTNPTQGTTTPTTTFDIDANYAIGSDLGSFSLNGSIPDRIGINLVLQNTATGVSTNLGTDFTIASSSGAHTYATSTTIAQGDYTLIATLVGDYGYVPPSDNCTPLLPFVTCLGSSNISTLATSLPPPTFSVANGNFPLLGFDTFSTASRNGLATTTCDVVHIGGCFQNALAFLFYPSPDVLGQFQFLWYNIKNKPPFGYVTQTISSLSGLNASTTPAFSFGTLPLMDSVFIPIRTGLAGLLWLLFGVAFYNRLRHIDI